MPVREEAVVVEWQRRLKRQLTVSRLTVVAVLGIFPIMAIEKIGGKSGGLPHGPQVALGLALLVFVAYIPVALVLSFIGFRCPKCNAYQGRRVGGRDRLSLGGRGPAACCACRIPFV